MCEFCEIIVFPMIILHRKSFTTHNLSLVFRIINKGKNQKISLKLTSIDRQCLPALHVRTYRHQLVFCERHKSVLGEFESLHEIKHIKITVWLSCKLLCITYITYHPHFPGVINFSFKSCGRQVKFTCLLIELSTADGQTGSCHPNYGMIIKMLRIQRRIITWKTKLRFWVKKRNLRV